MRIVAKPSPLSLVLSVVDELSIQAVSPAGKQKVKPLPIEIDFNLRLPSVENGNRFCLDMELDINKKRTKQVGYSIRFKVSYIFEVEGEVSKQDLSNLRQYSTLSIALASIRSSLATATAPYQFGAYRLPILDARQLIKDKISQQKAK